MPEEFDEVLYLLANPDVRELLARAEFASALDHWQLTGSDEHARGQRRSGFHDYDLLYDEAAYLTNNPDVAEAVRSGVFRDGYEHWIRHGRFEHDQGLRAGFERRHGALRPFKLALGAGELVALPRAESLPEIERVILRLSDKKRVTLDPRTVMHTAPVEFLDGAGRVHPRELVVLFVPGELTQRNGHARVAVSASLISTGGEVTTLTFEDAPYELPAPVTIDGAKALLRAVKRVERAAGTAPPPALLASAILSRLSAPSRVAGQPFVKVHTEEMLSIEGVGVYAVGWLIPANALLERCRAFCVETGECVEIQTRLVRSRRSDVWEAFKEELGSAPSDQFGFTALLELPEASRLPECRLVLGITPRDGIEVLSAPLTARPSRSFVDAAKVVLGKLNLASPDFETLMADTVAPAIETLWARERSRKTREVTVKPIGERPARPEVSVVVPVYGRADLIKYQLALFANDEDFRSGKVELVYFVDDPRLIETVIELAEGSFPLYRVPMLCAFTGENHGFSGANNLGVGQARGDLAILVNSDVVPKRADWASQIARAYAELPECGVLGVKLLYHDESLQHDGMSFERFPFWHGLYGNNHPGKGLPNRSELDAPAREVEAVTGACLAIERALYQRLGGLSEQFVFGDFEDSELCLRVRKAKKRVYYLPSVELYHLERQSQSLLPEGDAWRWQLTVYNAWLQNRVWGEFIDELKRAPFARRAPGGSSPPRSL